ncbi:MAG: hypothetical protein JXB32_15295 [Deltaproteobacteria bacterium]|nr:hypothetical protein [Deltaproteobacteria bacterium]
MRGGRIRRVAALCGVLAMGSGLLGPSVAAANVGRDWFPGDAAGEPLAGPALPPVEREALLLDLRPLAFGRPVRVVAAYRFRVDEELPELRLVFVSPGVVAGSVLLDGVPVPSSPLEKPALPPAWRAPVPLRGVGGEPVHFEADEARIGGLAFTTALAPGTHVLSVESEVRPGEYHGRRSPCREYLVAYLLAPARDWASLGELELTVELPPAWDYTASLELDRFGDRLVGRWMGLPADAIGLAVRPPGEATVLTTAAPWVGAGLGAVLGWLVGLWWGRRSARRGERTGRRWLKAVGLAYLAALLVAATTAATAVGGAALLDEMHRSVGWGTAYLYESLFAGVAGLAAAVLGFFAVFVWVHRAVRQAANVVLDEARRKERT